VSLAAAALDLRLVPLALTTWASGALLVARPELCVGALGGALGASAIAVAVALLMRPAARRVGRGGRPISRGSRLRRLPPAMLPASALVALAALAVAAVALVVGSTASLRQPALPSSGPMPARFTVDSGLSLVAHGGRIGEQGAPARGMVDVTVHELRVPGEPQPRHTELHGRLLAGVEQLRALAIGASAEARLTFRPGALAGSYWLEPSGDLRLSEPPPAWIGWVSSLRSAFAAQAQSLPGDGGLLLPGLSIGDTSVVSPELTAAMRDAGLGHLTAVSGANCAIVVALVLRTASWGRAARALRLVLALLALGLFVLLVTPEPSVQRASAMAALALLARAAGRRASGMGVLACAVSGLLVVDPWLSLDAGFALSALATAGLLLLARPIARVLSRALPARLAAVLSVPLAAQLGCAPVLALLDPSFSLLSVPANVLAEPAAAAGTVLGLVACLLCSLAPPLALPVLWLGWLPAAFIAGLARTASSLEAWRVAWPGGAWGVAVAAAATVLLAWLVLRLAAGRQGGALGLLLAICLLAWIGWSAGGPVLRRAGVPADWALTACDVGQGDALLLSDGRGAVMLVDTGPDPAALADCLSLMGVARVGLLVLTHYDLDHVGGLEAVAARVDAAVLPAAAQGDAAAERVRRRLQQAGAQLSTAHAGDRIRLGGLEGAVLWPPDRAEATPTGNEGSIVALVHSPAGAVLLLGDTDEDAQRAMRAQATAGIGARIVKVAHHGSADQDPRLYAELGAELALVSVGQGNGYGHPTRRTLELLAAHGAAVLRTDRDGTLAVLPAAEGEPLRVWRSGVRGAG